jgi:hypothetical protein
MHGRLTSGDVLMGLADAGVVVRVDVQNHRVFVQRALSLLSPQLREEMVDHKEAIVDAVSTWGIPWDGDFYAWDAAHFGLRP